MMIAEETPIESSVKRALKTRIGYVADSIQVVEDHGTVTLSGHVYSIDQRNKVLEETRATRGVVNVKDHMHFRGYRTEW
jgi:osmotically-inducible protein OsmY